MFFAKIANLTMLNRTKVKMTMSENVERKGAEIDYLKKYGIEWLDIQGLKEDDEKVVTWDEEQKLPYIDPTRPKAEYGLPRCHLAEMVGKRNRVFRVRMKTWNEYWRSQYAYKWKGKDPLSWEQGMMEFLKERLQIAGKELHDLFHEEPLQDDLPIINLCESYGGQAEEKVLYMKTCPSPLPIKSKSASAFDSAQASWKRG
jgi:hypothetical protein